MTQMAELVDSDNRKATSMLSQSMKTLCSKTHLRKHAWEKRVVNWEIEGDFQGNFPFK